MKVRDFPVELVCPRCRHALGMGDDVLHCDPCATDYPIVEGIPDLRLTPDPFIGLEEDRAKARRLEDRSRGLDFADTVRVYWEMTPTTSTDQAHRFVEHVLRAEARSIEWLERLDGADGPGPWLDTGCGTADLAAAAGDAVTVVGIDVAMRWLVAARKRLTDAGVPAWLVCANAEHLPFRDGSFRRVLSLGLLEHCENRAGVFLESFRVLAPGGTVHFRTVNRFSLLPEPHVGVWGVGFLPRAWADSYVRWRTGMRYQHHRPTGAGRLVRELRAAGFAEARVEAAPLLPTELGQAGPSTRRLGPIYERARTMPIASLAVRAVAPLLEGRGVVR